MAVCNRIFGLLLTLGISCWVVNAAQKPFLSREIPVVQVALGRVLNIIGGLVQVSQYPTTVDLCRNEYTRAVAELREIPDQFPGSLVRRLIHSLQSAFIRIFHSIADAQPVSQSLLYGLYRPDKSGLIQVRAILENSWRLAESEMDKIEQLLCGLYLESAQAASWPWNDVRLWIDPIQNQSVDQALTILINMEQILQRPVNFNELVDAYYMACQHLEESKVRMGGTEGLEMVDSLSKLLVIQFRHCILYWVDRYGQGQLDYHPFYVRHQTDGSSLVRELINIILRNRYFEPDDLNRHLLAVLESCPQQVYEEENVARAIGCLWWACIDRAVIISPKGIGVAPYPVLCEPEFSWMPWEAFPAEICFLQHRGVASILPLEEEKTTRAYCQQVILDKEED